MTPTEHPIYGTRREGWWPEVAGWYVVELEETSAAACEFIRTTDDGVLAWHVGCEDPEMADQGLKVISAIWDRPLALPEVAGGQG